MPVSWVAVPWLLGAPVLTGSRGWLPAGPRAPGAPPAGSLTGPDAGPPWVGLDLEPVTEGLARSLGRERVGGRLVRAVAPRSPAAWAGIRPGGRSSDLVAGPAVAHPAAVSAIVAAVSVGSVIGLGLRRGAEPLTVVFSVKRLPTR